MISLKEEIEFIVDAYASESKTYQRKAIVDNVLEKIEKRIDSMINDINQEFKNEGYGNIDSSKIYDILDYDDIVEYKQLEAQKSKLEEFKEKLK